MVDGRPTGYRLWMVSVAMALDKQQSQLLRELPFIEAGIESAGHPRLAEADRALWCR
jgi:hypothetical protein